MSLLAVEGLSREFGGIRAVDQLSFTVAAGQVQAVIGPNGAGKTTLFNIITGIYRPSAGRIRFDDRDVTGWPPHRLAGLGIARTFQNLQIFHNLSAIENVLVGCHLRNDRRLVPSLLRWPSVSRTDAACRRRAAELMDFVGLGGSLDAEASALSYGSLRRLEIARALAREPRLLLLDEPAAGLNLRETEEIDALIRRIAAAGTTVLLVEHDMRLVMAISDRILVLDYGRKLAEGTAAEVQDDPQVIAAYLGGEAGDAA